MSQKRDSGRRRFRAQGKIEVPVGLEQLLLLAASDARFHDRFFDDRLAAIEASGIALRPSELAALSAATDQALEAMIAGVVPQDPRRRRFMGMVAATMASLAAGGLSSCDLDQPDNDAAGGVRPGDVYVDSAADLVALAGETSVEGSLYIIGTNLTDLDGLESLVSIGRSLEISDNGALENLQGLGGLTQLGEDLYVTDNAVLPNCEAIGLRDRLRDNGWYGHAEIEDNEGEGTCEE